MLGLLAGRPAHARQWRRRPAADHGAHEARRSCSKRHGGRALRAPTNVVTPSRPATGSATSPTSYGGGHRACATSGYDCSGAVSYVLNGGDSRQPARTRAADAWGRRGKGAWITVFAHRGHAYMVVAACDSTPRGGRGQRPRLVRRTQPKGSAVALLPKRLYPESLVVIRVSLVTGARVDGESPRAGSSIRFADQPADAQASGAKIVHRRPSVRAGPSDSVLKPKVRGLFEWRTGPRNHAFNEGKSSPGGPGGGEEPSRPPDVRLTGLTQDATGTWWRSPGIDLEIASGEFFTLLGPSGRARRRRCG